jgi:hypothetical protein
MVADSAEKHETHHRKNHAPTLPHINRSEAIIGSLVPGMLETVAESPGAAKKFNSDSAFIRS